MVICEKVASFFKGSERTVKAKKNILGMTLLKGLSIGLNLLLVPMTIGYVSSLKYGIWLTLSSLITWLSFFDIGLGNGLRNKFAEAITLGNKCRARIYVSTTYAILGIIILGVWLLLSALAFWVDWSLILNAPSGMGDELRSVVLIVVTGFAFQFILKLMTTLLNALQKPALCSMIDTISQVLVVILILICMHFTEGSLFILALVTSGTYVFVLSLATLYYFSHQLKDFRPSVGYVQFRYAKDLMDLGVKFFFLQILAILFYATNNIIIAQICGPDEVTVYNVAYKYMNVMQMGFMILITPFWSAFTEAYVKKDMEWMKRTYRSLVKVFAFISGCGLLMLALSPWIFPLWLGDSVTVPFTLTLLLFVYQMFNVWGSMHSTIIYGIGKIKAQLLSSACVCCLNVPLAIIFCYHWGIIGLMIVQVLLIGGLLWIGPFQIRKLLNNSAYGIWNK